jgi:hypothetical protein
VCKKKMCANRFFSTAGAFSVERPFTSGRFKQKRKAALRMRSENQFPAQADPRQGVFRLLPQTGREYMCPLAGGLSA